jgi:hypothetical protein
VRRRLLAVRRRPDLHGAAGDLASRLAGSGPGGLASAGGGGLLAPTLAQQARSERVAAASDGGRAEGGEGASQPWLGAEERAARERAAAQRGDFGLPPGADVAEVEADASARDPRALLEALALLAGARHHSPPNRRMLLPLLRHAGPRLLSGEAAEEERPQGQQRRQRQPPDAAAAAALARPPEPLSSLELVDLAHAMARIGPPAAPTRRFLAQLLLALRARGFWDDGGERRQQAGGRAAARAPPPNGAGDGGGGSLARLAWALPQLAAWADDEGGGGASAPTTSPDERALWHLLIGRTLADDEGLPWLEREQRRLQQAAAGGAASSEPLPDNCVVSAQLAACVRLVRRRGPQGTPARELANMLAFPVSLAQQLEVASAEAAAAAAAAAAAGAGAPPAPPPSSSSSSSSSSASEQPPPATAFYSAAAEAVRAAALPLARAAVDALATPADLAAAARPLPLTVPFEAAALLGALAALGARPRAAWVRAAAAAALDEDFMLPLYELGELADVARALLAFAGRLEEEGGGAEAEGPPIAPAERAAWARALQRATVAAGAAAAAAAAEAGDRRADLAASRVQRAAREAAEALEALGAGEEAMPVA